MEANFSDLWMDMFHAGVNPGAMSLAIQDDLIRRGLATACGSWWTNKAHALANQPASSEVKAPGCQNTEPEGLE